jgi:transcriptional regulator with XRE-family HTH domain
METINNRIIKLRHYLGLKQTQFAQKIGVTSTLINKIEAGKTKVTESNIRLICFTFKVNEEWLREGKGEMLDEETLLSEWEKRLLALFKQLSPKAKEIFIEYADKLIADEQALREEASYRVRKPASPPVGFPLEPIRPVEAPSSFVEKKRIG